MAFAISAFGKKIGGILFICKGGRRAAAFHICVGFPLLCHIRFFSLKERERRGAGLELEEGKYRALLLKSFLWDAPPPSSCRERGAGCMAPLTQPQEEERGRK